MGLGARFCVPQMALRSYFPVGVGWGRLLAGDETMELELELELGGIGAGLEELEGRVVGMVGGLLLGVAG